MSVGGREGKGRGGEGREISTTNFFGTTLAIKKTNTKLLMGSDP